MNGHRAKRLRNLAHQTIGASVPESASQEARANLGRKLYGKLKSHWRGLSAQQRRAFGVSDARGLL